MRIIGGKHKGRTIKPPKGLELRPTTDFAKEGLFNILNNRIDLDGIEALDLFCGTGNISFELASRGARVRSVDRDYNCVQYINQTARELELDITATKSDVFRFLQEPGKGYDFVFADPPYDLENLPAIGQLVIERGWLKPGGWLIVEHGPRTRLESLPHFHEHRKYGNVNFSFFHEG